MENFIFCAVFIGFMVKGKRFLEYNNLFSPNEYEENDKKNIKIFLIDF